MILFRVHVSTILKVGSLSSPHHSNTVAHRTALIIDNRPFPNVGLYQDILQARSVRDDSKFSSSGFPKGGMVVGQSGFRHVAMLLSKM